LAESNKTAVVMTHSLTAVAEGLLHPERLYGVAELSEGPTLIPQEGGVYAWWFLKAPPELPVDDTAVHEGRRLLYVGIAPRKPSAAGSVSSRTLRHRLLTHCRGPIASSTLRRTLAVLLAQELELSISRAMSLKLRMPAEHETRLTQWMNENARVVWSTCSAPWEVEDHLIQGTARLPLNIRGSSHPFAKELSKLRSKAAS
jgi:GIY-YIG catalytic domain-containing protein